MGCLAPHFWQNHVQPVVMSNQCCHCIKISYLLSCLFLVPCNWPCSGGVSFLVSRHLTCLHACSQLLALQWRRQLPRLKTSHLPQCLFPATGPAVTASASSSQNNRGCCSAGTLAVTHLVSPWEAFLSVSKCRTSTSISHMCSHSRRCLVSHRSRHRELRSLTDQSRCSRMLSFYLISAHSPRHSLQLLLKSAALLTST